MSPNPRLAGDASNIVRSFEIFEDNKIKFRAIAEELIQKDAASFEYATKRILLTAHGPRNNQGFNLETENLDGTARFKDGWCYYPDNYDDRVKAITTSISLLAAEIETALPVK